MSALSQDLLLWTVNTGSAAGTQWKSCWFQKCRNISSFYTTEPSDPTTYWCFYLSFIIITCVLPSSTETVYSWWPAGGRVRSHSEWWWGSSSLSTWSTSPGNTPAWKGRPQGPQRLRRWRQQREEQQLQEQRHLVDGRDERVNKQINDLQPRKLSDCAAVKEKVIVLTILN